MVMVWMVEEELVGVFGNSVIVGGLAGKVIGKSVVVGGIMVSGGQVVMSLMKVTSARCTQEEIVCPINCRPIIGRSAPMLIGRHILIRASQELRRGSKSLKIASVSRSSNVVPAMTKMNSAPISHCVQLNIATSILVIPAKADVVPVKFDKNSIGGTPCNVTS